MENTHSDVLQTIRDKKELTNELKQKIDGLIKEFKQRFDALRRPAARG